MRSGPGTQYKVLHQLNKGDTILIRFVHESDKGSWGMVYYYQEQAYVSMRYVEFLCSYEPPAPEKRSWWKRIWDPVSGVVDSLWSIVKVVLIILAVLLVLAFWEDIMGIAIIAGFFAGGGALLFSIFGGDEEVGAIVGLCVAALMGIVVLLGHFGIGLPDLDFSFLFKVA